MTDIPGNIPEPVPATNQAAPKFSEEWCLKMAALEGNAEIGAGSLDHPLRCPPATNQAGEVEREDTWSDFFNDHLTDGNDGYRAANVIERCRAAFDAAWPRGWEAAHAAGLAALATQPATSQEGEACENNLPKCTNCGAPAGLDCRTAQGRIPPCYGREVAATPTPPTLSEDLWEALSDQLDDVDDSLRNGALACSVMLGKPQAEWLRAALAQVKA